jgi:hypothetical protein
MGNQITVKVTTDDEENNAVVRFFPVAITKGTLTDRLLLSYCCL